MGRSKKRKVAGSPLVDQINAMLNSPTSEQTEGPPRLNEQEGSEKNDTADLLFKLLNNIDKRLDNIETEIQSLRKEKQTNIDEVSNLRQEVKQTKEHCIRLELYIRRKNMIVFDSSYTSDVKT